MISVILYGRNDSYGYNLHKRAALSLNCIAAVLDHPADEIIFVDYNTPDDFPTFPEAIRDTLTARARELLRILRVRPADHARFAARSHLVALEPVARNVALRRADPANRWVLSTNTDMIFVPPPGRSLSAIAAGLPDGYYHLPRFELPETLWEMLDRAHPAATIATVGAWGRRYHLDEIVTLPRPAVRYDGPGDFQLMLRQELADMHGFDERMLLGWHVDSNIAVRLALRHGGPGDIDPGEVGAGLRGYHCDHTRQATPAHRPGVARNDWVEFVDQVTEARAPDQPGWGLADAAVEELRLHGDAAYLAALDAAVPAPVAAAARVAYDGSFLAGDPGHVAPFLIDALCTAPPGTVVGWIGGGGPLLACLQAAWARLGFAAPIRAAEVWPPPPDPAALDRVIAAADVLVVEFSADLPIGASLIGHPAVDAVAVAFRRAVAAERARMETRPPRRFIAVNAVANAFEAVVAAAIGATSAPFSTRLRQGFVRPLQRAPRDLMPALHAGVGGRRTARGLAIRPGVRGLAFVAIADELLPGRWRLELELAPGLRLPGPLKLEAVRGAERLAQRYFPASALAPLRVALDFAAPHGDPPPGVDPAVLFRLHTIGLVGAVVTAVRLIPLTN